MSLATDYFNLHLVNIIWDTCLTGDHSNLLDNKIGIEILWESKPEFLN
jgi:hypothetical protein